MEPLQKRSDGFFETLSGAFAVFPIRYSGQSDSFRWFQFKTTAVAEPTLVRWPIEDKIVVINSSVAQFMLNNGYAVHPSEEHVQEWNDLVAELEAAAPALDPPEKPEEPQEPQTPPPAPTPPANPTIAPETGAEGGENAGDLLNGGATGEQGEGNQSEGDQSSEDTSGEEKPEENAEPTDAAATEKPATKKPKKGDLL